MKSVFKSCASFAALSLASLSASAYAAEQAPAAAQPASDDGLNAIVVTASTGDKSKLNSSISISSVSASTIADFRPNSQGDLLRLLPGLQPNISGPGGNGNFAVRGLPVATGGATFVQLQEDGLPQVLYGDIQFGNNDYFTKFDALTESVDAVRGGTAATMASQAPGAVINYISKTSKSEGGFVELEKGEF
jgi:outer membrane receptor protein involved in Fe transport